MTALRYKPEAPDLCTELPLRADCVEKLADDYLKAMFAQGSFTFYVFLESSLRSPRVADSNITDKNGCPSFSTQSGKLARSSIETATAAKAVKRSFAPFPISRSPGRIPPPTRLSHPASPLNRADLAPPCARR